MHGVCGAHAIVIIRTSDFAAMRGHSRCTGRKAVRPQSQLVCFTLRLLSCISSSFASRAPPCVGLPKAVSAMVGRLFALRLLFAFRSRCALAVSSPLLDCSIIITGGALLVARRSCSYRLVSLFFVRFCCIARLSIQQNRSFPCCLRLRLLSQLVSQ